MGKNDWSRHSIILQNYLLDMNTTLRTRPTDNEEILNYLVSIEYQMALYTKWKDVLEYIKENKIRTIYSMIKSEKEFKMY
jgi:hypothetical protein